MTDRRDQSNQRRDRSPKVSPEAAAAAAEQFLAAVKVSEQRDKVRREKERAERVERDRVEGERRAKDTALNDAQRELARAIATVRRAKESGKGRAEADAAWKAAKARVIELETGVAPAWAPVAAPADATADAAADLAADAGSEAASPDESSDGTTEPQ